MITVFHYYDWCAKIKNTVLQFIHGEDAPRQTHVHTNTHTQNKNITLEGVLFQKAHRDGFSVDVSSDVHIFIIIFIFFSSSSNQCIVFTFHWLNDHLDRYIHPFTVFACYSVEMITFVWTAFRNLLEIARNRYVFWLYGKPQNTQQKPTYFVRFVQKPDFVPLHLPFSPEYVSGARFFISFFYFLIFTFQFETKTDPVILSRKHSHKITAMLPRRTVSLFSDDFRMRSGTNDENDIKTKYWKKREKKWYAGLGRNRGGPQLKNYGERTTASELRRNGKTKNKNVIKIGHDESTVRGALLRSFTVGEAEKTDEQAEWMVSLAGWQAVAGVQFDLRGGGGGLAGLAVG